MRIHFLHYISDKTKLANNNVTNKNINFFLGSVQAASIVRFLSSFASRYKNIFHIEVNGLINYILKFLTQDKNSASELILVTFTKQDRENLGLKRTVVLNRFVIIIEIKKILALIRF